MSNPNIAPGVDVQVGKDTRFKPGQVANPKGRPRTKFISEALKIRLENGGADQIGDGLLKIAQSSKQHSVRVRAAEVIRDSTEGKPVQSHRLEVGIDADTAKVLAELAIKLL